MARAEIHHNRKAKHIIQRIHRVINNGAFLCGTLLILYARFKEYRFNGRHGHGQDFCCKGGHDCGVNVDFRHGRLFNLGHRMGRVFTQARHIVVSKIKVGYPYHIVTGNFFHAFNDAIGAFPGVETDPCPAHDRNPIRVRFQPCLFALLVVVDNGGNQPVLKFALADQCQLFEQ